MAAMLGVSLRTVRSCISNFGLSIRGLYSNLCLLYKFPYRFFTVTLPPIQEPLLAPIGLMLCYKPCFRAHFQNIFFTQGIIAQNIFFTQSIIAQNFVMFLSARERSESRYLRKPIGDIHIFLCFVILSEVKTKQVVFSLVLVLCK